MKHILTFIAGLLIGAAVYHYLANVPDPPWLEDTQPVKVRQW